MDKQNDNHKKVKIKKESNEYIEEGNSKKLFLNKMNKIKEKIHSEICYLINKNMNNIENRLEKMNKDGTLYFNYSRTTDKNKFLNYSGEKISIISNPNSNSNGQTIEKEEKEEIKNNDEHINHRNIKISNKSNNFNLKDENINKKLSRNPINLIKLSIPNIKNTNNINYGIETNTEKETIINISNFGEINDLFDKFGNSNSIEENEIISNYKKEENKKGESKIRNIFIYNNAFRTPQKNLNDNKNTKINLKESHRLLHSPSFSLFDSTSTCNTFKKNKNNFKFKYSIEDTCNNNIYLRYNKSELINFFAEINLPTIYAEKFIENGFDDLNIILTLTKTSIAITNQNLKDIGIFSAGHRAQILIHLEERAEIFPFYLETKIIYNSKDINSQNLYNDSLFKFLNRIGCQAYLNNFRRIGYFNSELLFSQMLTREPINKEMLEEDFCIDKEDSLNKIYTNLKEGCKNYIKKLRKKNNNSKIIFEDKIYRNSCESCIVF